LNKKNTELMSNFYDIYSADYIFKNIEVKDTSNNFFQLYDKSTLKQTKIKYNCVIYYNTHLDFSYESIDCHRTKQ
jgi:hypothetical protein